MPRKSHPVAREISEEKAAFILAHPGKKFISVTAAANKRARDAARREKNRGLFASRSREYYERNKDRLRGRAKTWLAAHPGYPATQWRQWKYNLSPADYAEMVVTQGGVCAICEEPPKPGKVLAVDHDHATGKIRQLLCNACNVRVGHIESSMFTKTQAYIARHSVPTSARTACPVVEGEP